MARGGEANPDPPICAESALYWCHKPKEETGQEGTAFQTEVAASVDPTAAMSTFNMAPQAILMARVPDPAALLLQVPANQPAASSEAAPTGGRRGRFADVPPFMSYTIFFNKKKKE